MKLVHLKPPFAAALLVALGAGLHHVVPAAYRGHFACRACGALAAGIGFALMMWAWALFGRAGAPVRPTARAVTLVCGGPFRFSRNPMYLGMVVTLSGIAVWVGSFPMLIAPAGFFAFISAVFIPYEEGKLREAFGEEYVAYTRAVRRWF